MYSTVSPQPSHHALRVCCFDCAGHCIFFGITAWCKIVVVFRGLVCMPCRKIQLIYCTALESIAYLHVVYRLFVYMYFCNSLFVSISQQSVYPTFSVRPRSSVGRVTVDLIRRSWVRFPPRSKDFFFTSCGSLIPFTRANAQWVIHGFK